MQRIGVGGLLLQYLFIQGLGLCEIAGLMQADGRFELFLQAVHEGCSARVRSTEVERSSRRSEDFRPPESGRSAG